MSYNQMLGGWNAAPGAWNKGLKTGPNPKKSVKWTEERKRAFSQKWTSPYSLRQQAKFLGISRKSNKLKEVLGLS